MQADFGSLLSSSSSSSSSTDLFGVVGGAGASALGRARPPRRQPPRTIQGKRKWLVGERIGSGASSVVRAGIDVQNLQMAAVKVLDMRKLKRCRGAVERVRAEIRVLRALKHPGVVALMDVVDDADRQRIHLVLEMVNGCSLQDLIQKEGDGNPCNGRALPVTQVANFAVQTLKALDYVHGQGYVHRDVKPANLLITAAGKVKLSDFGVAEKISVYTTDDSVSKTLGSPAFQAPEIASGADAYSGTKVDVWALGVTLFYLLTGQVPFTGESHMALFNCISKGVYHFPDDIQVPDDARDCIAKMLVVDFEERWSVDQLLKHPWVLAGAKSKSAQQQKELGWIEVAARNFNVLELANRFLEENADEVDGVDDDEALVNQGVLSDAFRLL